MNNFYCEQIIKCNACLGIYLHFQKPSSRSSLFSEIKWIYIQKIWAKLHPGSNKRAKTFIALKRKGFGVSRIQHFEMKSFWTIKKSFCDGLAFEYKIFIVKELDLKWSGSFFKTISKVLDDISGIIKNIIFSIWRPVRGETLIFVCSYGCVVGSWSYTSSTILSTF